MKLKGKYHEKSTNTKYQNDTMTNMLTHTVTTQRKELRESELSDNVTITYSLPFHR